MFSVPENKIHYFDFFELHIIHEPCINNENIENIEIEKIIRTDDLNKEEKHDLLELCR